MTRTELSCPTHWATIFIAGDPDAARHICQQHAFDVGLCVTVEEALYVYSGGAEAGVRVGLINYPRFPDTPENIDLKAEALADLLLVGLGQWSCTIMSPANSKFVSRRPSESR